MELNTDTTNIYMPYIVGYLSNNENYNFFQFNLEEIINYYPSMPICDVINYITEVGNNEMDIECPPTSPRSPPCLKVNFNDFKYSDEDIYIITKLQRVVRKKLYQNVIYHRRYISESDDE